MPTPHRHLSVDELSHRASTGLAIRRGDIKISEPIPSSYVHNGAEMDGTADQPFSSNEAFTSPPGRNGQGASHGRSGSAPLSSNTVHISRFTERTSSGNTPTIGNTMPIAPSEPQSQRRDGGIRASLKRMFSKKSNATTIQKRGAYHSDPGRFATINNPQNHSLHQSAVHYDRVTPGHPLSSHATSPQLRIQMADNRSQTSDLGQLGKRRNTLPILDLNASDEPQTIEQRRSDQSKEDPIPRRPGTSTPQATPTVQHLNRRSKSAGALTDLVLTPKSKSADRRDRSEEIAFWRNSVINDPIPQMPSIESMSSLNSFKAQPRSRKSSSKHPRPSIEPVQDFDFGLSDGSNALRSTTLQERVNTLEVKLFDFEYALAKLQGTDLTKPTLNKKKVSPQRSVRSPVPESRASSSSTNNTSCLSSPDEKWSSPPLRQQPQHRQDRTSKATTIKATHTRRPSSRSQVSTPSFHITRSQYDALQAMIEEEKVARHQLEMRMITLQQQFEGLKTPTYVYARPVQYPTPSPDSFHNTTTINRSAAVERSPPVPQQKLHNEMSRFSMSETDPETETDPDDRHHVYMSSPEVFETPQEGTFRFESRTISPSGMF